LAADLNLRVFFCHPQTLGSEVPAKARTVAFAYYLLTRADLSLVSDQQQPSAHEEMLNERPVKLLGWKSPAQSFVKALYQIFLQVEP
jgi:IS30 family transposase